MYGPRRWTAGYLPAARLKSVLETKSIFSERRLCVFLTWQRPCQRRVLLLTTIDSKSADQSNAWITHMVQHRKIKQSSIHQARHDTSSRMIDNGFYHHEAKEGCWALGAYLLPTSRGGSEYGLKMMAMNFYHSG